MQMISYMMKSTCQFEGSEATSDFSKKIHILFDLFNSRNPFAIGTKQPVTKEYLPLWGAQCDELSRYIFDLKDEGEDTCEVVNVRQPSGDLHSAFIL